jgi:hypothetical protein
MLSNKIIGHGGYIGRKWRVATEMPHYGKNAAAFNRGYIYRQTWMGTN